MTMYQNGLPRIPEYNQPVNWRHPLNVGLRLWMRALPQNTGGFYVSDLISNRYPATFTSGAWVAGQRGTLAPSYDGAASVLTAATFAEFSSLRSWAFWVLRRSGGQGAVGRIFTKGGREEYFN